jgi:NAD-dependent DNA ligase
LLAGAYANSELEKARELGLEVIDEVQMLALAISPLPTQNT